MFSFRIALVIVVTLRTALFVLGWCPSLQQCMFVSAVISCNVIVSLTWADVGVVCWDSSVVGRSVSANVHGQLAQPMGQSCVLWNLYQPTACRRELACLLPISTIIVIMFFYALSCLFNTNVLYCYSVLN